MLCNPDNITFKVFTTQQQQQKNQNHMMAQCCIRHRPTHFTKFSVLLSHSSLQYQECAKEEEPVKLHNHKDQCVFTHTAQATPFLSRIKILETNTKRRHKHVVTITLLIPVWSIINIKHKTLTFLVEFVKVSKLSESCLYMYKNEWTGFLCVTCGHVDTCSRHDQAGW